MRTYFLFILTFAFFGLNAQNAKPYLRAAEQFIANGYFEDAIEQLDKALELDPQFAEAFQERAKAYEKTNNLEKAAQDYKNAAVFGLNPAENYFLSAQLHFKLNNLTEASETLVKAISQKTKYHEAYLLQCQLFLLQNRYKDANIAAINALEAKGTAYAQYLKGLTEYELANYSQAEEDFEKVISRDKMLIDAYLYLARVQLLNNMNRSVIDNCNFVLTNEINNVSAYFLRSKAYNNQLEFEKAIIDISKAISLDPDNPDYFIQRGEFYMNYSQFQNAINDLTVALNKDKLNKQALQLRATAYEKIGNAKGAVSDYSLLTTLLDDTEISRIATIERKIFELNRESEKPKIVLLSPTLSANEEALVPNDSRDVKITVQIKDASKLQFFKVNNDTLLNDAHGLAKYEFQTVVRSADLDFITLSATDIYNNTETVSYAVERIETHPPTITLLNPYPGDDGIITLSDDDRILYLEGRIEDESQIASIHVDEVTASYAPRDPNPRFTATVDISKKNRIMLEATDIYGNTTCKEFLFRRDGRILSEESPMGKTWAILIENSEYKDFPNLYSPASDVELVQQALSRYKINKIILKKNLTKREMERFFSIDLRDLVRVNEVNSLFIWFAGHGKNNRGTGYWIPSDANLNDEFSYFSINALRASLYAYTSLSHILLVSDACETGAGFCIAMRGPIENIACSQTQLAVKKSAQVLTSAGAGYAYDNSFFTRAFANALLNNEDDCSSIDDIARRISLIMQGSSSQTPEFGRIAGLPDELGTFFFISR